MLDFVLCVWVSDPRPAPFFLFSRPSLYFFMVEFFFPGSFMVGREVVPFTRVRWPLSPMPKTPLSLL